LKQHRRIPVEGTRFTVLDGAREETWFERNTGWLLAGLFILGLVASALAN